MLSSSRRIVAEAACATASVGGFLFELISESNGASPAFALLFDADADARTKRDVVIEATDRLLWESGRKKRRMQVLTVNDGPLLEYLRFCAIRVT